MNSCIAVCGGLLAAWILAMAPHGADAAGSPADNRRSAGGSSEGIAGRMEKIDETARQLRAKRADLVFPRKKKLIHNGHDMDGLRLPDIARNIRQMETAPFDGIVIRLSPKPVGQAPFEPKPWKEEAFIEELESLAAIEWGTFTDNFIWVNCTGNLDWFDDDEWQTVLGNTRIIAKAALLGRCAGIFFDAETYGAHSWSYQEGQHAKTKTFEEYAAQLRKRGAEWMQTVQDVCPRVRILTSLFTANQYLVIQDLSSTGRDDPLTEKGFSPEQVHKRLASLRYALLPAFTNGMLAATQEGSVFIDGNENAYYYKKQADYLKYRQYFEQYAPRAFIDKDLRQKFGTQVQLGSSFYPDYYYPGRYGKSFATYLAPEESARWAEHNIYWALKTTDEYVWEWGELQNWWLGRLDAEARPHSQDKGYYHASVWKRPLGRGYEQAVRSAREKIEKGQPLGFESDILFKDMMERIKKKIPAVSLKKLTGPAPKVDGLLDDPAWTDAYASEPFIPEVDWNPKLNAPTKARLCYDDQALYVALECGIPQAKSGKKTNDRAATGAFNGHHVEVLFATPAGEFPMYRFGINAGGKTAGEKVLSLAKEEWDDSYKPQWQSALHSGEGTWTAEIAIPWAAIGVESPAPGATLRLNLARQWPRDDERSSWSPTLRWFSSCMEPQMCGTVRLE